MNWDDYNTRVTINGTTQRERNLNRLKQNISNKAPANLSYKQVKLNGVDTQVVINTGTKPYYKEFESLPGEKITMGDYIEWAGRTWLVYEADSDDEVYVDGKLYECNYLLRWINADGKIIERWAYVQNASAYNNGEKGSNTLTLATNQYMVWMPLDSDTISIRNGKRMFIDNFSDEPYCYSLTRPDNVSMKFGSKGCTYYIFTQTETNKEKDKLVKLENGEEAWIADYYITTLPSIPETPEGQWTMKIECPVKTIMPIGKDKKLSALLVDVDGNEVPETTYEWSIVSNISKYITSLIKGNILTLSLSSDCEDYGELIQITVMSKYSGQSDSVTLTVKGVF